MANIVIVENDPRLAAQIHQYLMDLDDSHRIRQFTTINDFQQIYSPKNPQNQQDSLTTHPLFQSFNDSQATWTLAQQIQDTSPFAGPVGKFLVNAEGKILEIDAETKNGQHIFGHSPAELTEQGNLAQLVAKPFADLWREFLRHLKQDKVISTALLFGQENQPYWILKVSGKLLEGNLIQLVLRYQPEVFTPLLKAYQSTNIPSESEDPGELQLLSTIDMVIFNPALVKGLFTHWLDSISQFLKSGGFFPPDFRTRFVAVKYEDDMVEPKNWIHPVLDDLIYLPLDRLIFMQKMEILFGLPGKTRPSFLFVQEEILDIEIAKLANMEKLSDIGCAIHNLLALKPGTRLRLKFQIPEQNQLISILARTFQSIPHPDHPNEFLVYCYFFGIDRETLKNLKKFLARRPQFQPLIDSDNSNFSYSEQNLFLTAKEKELKNIVILDANQASADSLAGMIRDEIQQTQIFTENSNYIFLKDYLADPTLNEKNSASNSSQGSNEESKAIELAPPKDFFAQEVSWTISAENRQLIDMRSKFKGNESLLDYPVSELFQTKDGWKQLFQGKDNENLLSETLGILSSSEYELRKKFALTAKTGVEKWVEVLFTPLPPRSEQIMITLSAIKSESWMKNEKRPEKIDLLIVSDSLVPSNVDSWIEGIHQLAIASQLYADNQPFKVIVISEENKNIAEIQKKYRHTQVAGLQFKPFDLRSLLLQVSFLCGSPFTKHHFENQNYVSTSIPTHITKEAKMIGLSEFGASVVHPTEIPPGTVLYLHEGIFERAPGENLAARFYHCEPNPSQKNTFLCSFTYFGIKDSFLKFCRTWIRDNYAAKKAKEA